MVVAGGDDGVLLMVARKTVPTVAGGGGGGHGIKVGHPCRDNCKMLKIVSDHHPNPGKDSYPQGISVFEA